MATPAPKFLRGVRLGRQLGEGVPGNGMRQATERWVEPVVFDVFTPDGEFIGRVHTPPRSRFMNASGSKVWLVVTDELGIPTVVRYTVMNGTSDQIAAGWKYE